MKRILIYITTLTLLTLSFNAFATNLRFLYNSAAQRFNSQDWTMFEATSEKALNTTPNGKKLT